MKTKLLRKIRRRYYIYIEQLDNTITVYDKKQGRCVAWHEYIISDVIELILKDMRFFELRTKFEYKKRMIKIKQYFEYSKLKL